MIMEFKGIILPKLNTSCIQSKAKQIWDKLNEDNIEINVKTSAMGVLLLAVGIGVAVGISECLAQNEIKKALRKQKKELDKEKEAEIEALKAEAEASEWV